MARTRFALRPAAAFAIVAACLCRLPFPASVFGGPFTENVHGEPSQSAERPPGYADLLRVLDCATRQDQWLAVRPELYATDSFRVRYVYRVRASDQDDHVLHLALYHRDGRTAALFETWFEGPASKRTFVLRDGANLERRGTRWVVKDILNGGAATWREIARLADTISAAPLVEIPRSSVTHSNAACEFPPRSATYFSVSTSADQSNWKFKGGATKGIPLTSHSGPFNNSDLTSVPSREVFMNTYGF